MGLWEFIILFCPLFYVFKSLHNKKEKTSLLQIIITLQIYEVLLWR